MIKGERYHKYHRFEHVLARELKPLDENRLHKVTVIHVTNVIKQDCDFGRGHPIVLEYTNLTYEYSLTQLTL